MQRPLRRSRSFKVTDFGTNRKLTYDFLLVINTNLPLILHRFQVMGWLIIGKIFASERGVCLTLTLSANIAINDISLKTRFFGLHFCCRKYPCIFNHFYVIRHESYRIRRNYAAVRAITPFKDIQGHRVWYQSKAHMGLLLVINTNLAPTLHRFRDSVR